MKSKWSVVVVSILLFAAGFFYYPKWKKTGSEAAISWDVSGYYHYLPSIFIYHDLKEQKWMDDINQKYLPSPAYDQSFIHPPTGNKVNKYFIGQALLYSPAFFLAHAYAKIFDRYPADGYSKPYQIAIWLSGLLVSILGLILLRRILLFYFEDPVVTWIILTIGLATNYFEYAPISKGMNHTWLFTLLCALIFFTIQFYRKFTWSSACGIGVFLGLAVLTRPTEAIWVIIPLLWGAISIRDRIKTLLPNFKKVIPAVLICGLLLSLQIIYWKYVTGEWLIHTYGDQKFDWLHPNIYRGLIGSKIGWWLYTPIMLIAMFGWYGLYKKQKEIFWPVFLTCFLAIYITLSWSHFESGGGLGQRNLIQIYPLLAFPLGYVIKWFLKFRTGKFIWPVIFLVVTYYNMWWIHQAHLGGFFQPGQMTTPYFFSVVGKLHPPTDYFKLLDTREYFNGTPDYLSTIVEDNFDNDTSSLTVALASGGKAARLDKDHQFFGPYNIPITNECTSWIRLRADFTIQSREWDVWKFTQWIVQFYNEEKLIKT